MQNFYNVQHINEEDFLNMSYISRAKCIGEYYDSLASNYPDLHYPKNFKIFAKHYEYVPIFQYNEKNFLEPCIEIFHCPPLGFFGITSLQVSEKICH